MASYVPLETQTPVSRESWCEVRERLSKTNLRHRFSRLVSRLQLHPSRRFSPADLPQVLIVCLFFFFLKREGPQIYKGKSDPSPSKGNADLRGWQCPAPHQADVVWSIPQTQHIRKDSYCYQIYFHPEDVGKART